MEIKIKGEIGWEVCLGDIERQLRFADGDIKVLLDTPGGGVYEGISIYNALKNYSKGKVKVHVTGMACSMGSYIMLVGKLPGNELIFEPNSIVMVHNPSGGAWGDYRDMQSYSQLLMKLTDLFRNKYIETTSLTYDEITKMMDDTTYFIGKDELETWGTVLNPDSEKDVLDTDILKASAVERINALEAKMTKEVVKADLDKVAKMFAPESAVMSMSDSNQQSQNNRLENEKQEEKMDLNELKNKYPDIYNQVMREGYQNGLKAGIETERKRVQDHMQFMDIDNAKDLVADAIKDGTPFADMFAKYTRLSLNDKEIKDMQNSSPKDVNPSEANKFQVGGISAKEKSITDEVEKGLAAIGLWEAK